MGPTRVWLHVYSLGASPECRMTNTVLRACKTGAFHCGVEVHNQEWSYEVDGVFCCGPKRWQEAAFFESIAMGTTLVSEHGVLYILLQLGQREWTGSRYDILSHNCCHFAKAFCNSLGTNLTPIPDWVTNLAAMGAAAEHTASSWDCCSCCSVAHAPADADLNCCEPIKLTTLPGGKFADESQGPDI